MGKVEIIELLRKLAFVKQHGWWREGVGLLVDDHLQLFFLGALDFDSNHSLKKLPIYPAL